MKYKYNITNVLDNNIAMKGNVLAFIMSTKMFFNRISHGIKEFITRNEIQTKNQSVNNCLQQINISDELNTLSKRIIICCSGDDV